MDRERSVSESRAVARSGEVDHRLASETYRLRTFDSLQHYPSSTRRQLALAGFSHQQSQCLCAQCEVKISFDSIDENVDYAANHFRRWHRELIDRLNRHCAFLICQSGTNIDDLRPVLLLDQQTIRWDDAEHPQFDTYAVRLETFSTWTHDQQSFVTPVALAKHGFFFSGPHDGVTCFYCGNTLTNWSEAVRSTNESIVQIEHVRFFPCRFLIYTAGRKFVANTTFFHTVSEQERRFRTSIPATADLDAQEKPQSVEQCRTTFADWPDDAPVSAYSLAQVGFYSLGDHLRVKCYGCGLEVGDWSYGMTALGTHRLESKDCPVIRAIESTKTGEIDSVNEAWRLQTFDGFTLPQTDGVPRPSIDSQRLLFRQLAASGFYRYKNTRIIRCTYCGVSIEPRAGQSIAFQHRSLVKQSIKKRSPIDCPMVRAQCPTNITVVDRERFPEHPDYQSIFERRKSFDDYQRNHRTDQGFIDERAEAGFFQDTPKRMRCFQCGNSLPIHDKHLHAKYPQYNPTQLHAHFYPTCEWLQEILGSKYLAQVLHDRTRPPPSTGNATSSTRIDAMSLSDYSDASDTEGYEPVATPFKAHYNEHLSPSSSPHESPGTAAGQTCAGVMADHGRSSCTSPALMHTINPFEQLASQPKSPPITLPSADLSPVDRRTVFVTEATRLDSFLKQGRDQFAEFKVEELAYAGFYFRSHENAVECVWCSIHLTEEQFRDIKRRRPSTPGSPLNNDPWTPMRIHRHAIGQLIDKNGAWCPWVRRELDQVYQNKVRNESFLHYPEHPSYEKLEERIKSFGSDWTYPSGTRLSNGMMAEAGFIYLGDDKVCCYYCGNRLLRFEPLDCPFEEHATFHPLCDYIISKRGQSYVHQVFRESERIPQAWFKVEVHDAQQIKLILFDESGWTRNKLNRVPVRRIDRRALSLTTPDSSRDDDVCELCCEQPPVYVYNPCQHSPMCHLCSMKLDQKQHEECFTCSQPAKLHSRSITAPL